MGISLLPESSEQPSPPARVIDINAIVPSGSVEVIESVPFYLTSTATGTTNTALIVAGSATTTPDDYGTQLVTQSSWTDNTAMLRTLDDWAWVIHRQHASHRYHATGSVTNCRICQAEDDASWVRMTINSVQRGYSVRDWAVYDADSEVIGEAVVRRDPLRQLREEFHQEASEDNEAWAARLTMIKQVREQQAREEANRRATEHAEKERLREIRWRSARDKAKSLLMSVLTPEQIDTFERKEYIDVVSRQTQTKFRVWTNHGHHGNIVQMGADGQPEFNWCVAPGGDGMILPHEDRIAGQVLMLEHCEAELRTKANVSRIAYRRPNAA
jgi:hypothetical protein